jgi:hypothetical protein
MENQALPTMAERIINIFSWMPLNIAESIDLCAAKGILTTENAERTEDI